MAKHAPDGGKHARGLGPAVLAAGLLGLVVLLVASADPLVSPAGAHEPPVRASALVSPHVQFLGDAAGTVFSFTIANPSRGRPIGAVQIAVPSKLWVAMACPLAPHGWIARRYEHGCRYRKRIPVDGGGGIVLGATSSTFQMTAGTREGPANETGTFDVRTGSTYDLFDGDGDDYESLGQAAAAEPGGLDVTAFSFQVLDVVVAASPAVPGSPCPAPSRTATTGSVRTLVVCGRNRTDQTLTPSSSFSSLRGSFVESAGTFSSAPIAGGSSSSVVLGSWDAARTAPAAGGGDMTAAVGSSATQTSPFAVLAGFELASEPVAPTPVVAQPVAVKPVAVKPARNRPPVANPQDAGTREDTPVAITLTAADPDGDHVTMAVVSAPGHGTLTGSAPNVTYTPERDYFGPDSFTFTASDGRSASVPATVAIAVGAVDDAPSFTVGADVAAPAMAGPQRIARWATGISAGPANESSQHLTFVVAGNTTPRLFADPPAVSPEGTLTFTPGASSVGSSTITLTLRDDGGTANGGVDTSPPFTFVVSVRGPTLTALSTTRASSGPPGAGLELAGAGYGDCRQVYFFFDGKRIGSARPDREGQVRGSGFAVPGDAEPGRHVVETSCRPAGRTLQVRRTFVVAAADLHRSVVVTSLPKPSDIDLSPKSVGASAAGSIALILLVAFPGGLLDTTLDEHYDEVRGWFRLRPRAAVVARQPGRMLRVLTLVGFLAVGGLAGAFLDPRFGFNESTLALALGLSVSLGVVFLGFELPGIAYRRSRHREWGRVVLHPGALALTAALVGASRVMHLQPGYLFGLIGGLVFTSELHQKAESRLTVASSLFILTVALAAWFAWVPVSAAATGPHSGLWLVGAEAALAGIFAAGLESLVVGLLPLREMDGSTLKAWSLVDWVAVYGLGAFAYVLIILRPASGSGADSSGQMTRALIIAGVFAVLSITFWAYFHFRSDPTEESPTEAA